MKKLIIALILAVGAIFFAYQSGYLPPQLASAPKPQTPTPPFPYAVEEFEVRVGADGPIIAGTLTIPTGEGPFPAAVLLSVAGPNDRDQGFAGHVGFHVIADRLTRNGYAVARYDDRGVNGSTGNYFQASWSDLAEDAISVTQYLAADGRIDDGKIGYVGMSQGGAIGALAASRRPETSFLMLLSAPGLPGEEALKLQLEKTLTALNVDAKRADRFRALFEEYMVIAKSDPDDPATRDAMADFMKGPGRALIPPYAFLPDDSEGLVSVLLGPWYRSNVLFDPEVSYGGLDLPVLAVAGGKDFVAPAEQHLHEIERILCAAPTDEHFSATFENLNHLLQEADSGLPTEYATLENTISEEFLSLMTAWLKNRQAVSPSTKTTC